MSKTSRACNHGIIVIILLTSTTCLHLYPDLSCVEQQEPSAQKWAAHFCQSNEYLLYSKSPNVCFEKCMLKELKILDWTDFQAGITTYGFYNYTGHNYNVGLPVILGRKEAEKYSTKIIQNCDEILNDLANVQKLGCREWSPVYSCVNDVFACEPYQHYQPVDV